MNGTPNNFSATNLPTSGNIFTESESRPMNPGTDSRFVNLQQQTGTFNLNNPSSDIKLPLPGEADNLHPQGRVEVDVVPTDIRLDVNRQVQPINLNGNVNLNGNGPVGLVNVSRNQLHVGPQRPQNESPCDSFKSCCDEFWRNKPTQSNCVMTTRCVSQNFLAYMGIGLCITCVAVGVCCICCACGNGGGGGGGVWGGGGGGRGSGESIICCNLSCTPRKFSKSFCPEN